MLSIGDGEVYHHLTGAVQCTKINEGKLGDTK